MAADTAAKRYSAMDLGCPWRGLNVVPDVAIPQGERQAVMDLYSGILAAGPPTFRIEWAMRSNILIGGGIHVH